MVTYADTGVGPHGATESYDDFAIELALSMDMEAQKDTTDSESHS